MRLRNRRLHELLERACCVIAPTKFVRELYAGLGMPTANLRVVPHGIAKPERGAAAMIGPASSDTPRPLRAGYVGSINYLKGLHVLIEAVNRLPDGAIELTIYGNLDSYPEYVAQLRRQARNAGVNFAGAIEREATQRNEEDGLWHALARLDVLLLPTLWYEASPLTVDEAFAAGLPIVASHIGAMSEKIADGVNGRLFPPGDVEALSVILRELAEEPSRLRTLRDGIPEVLSMSDHWKRLALLYQSCLHGL
jgi:glycosyltransferase involved in cell wall biosynthesis